MEQKVLNGWFVLHDMREFVWEKWKNASSQERQSAVDQLIRLLDKWDRMEDQREGSHMLYTMVGHKADLMLLILRPTIVELNKAEAELSKTTFMDFTRKTYSYLSTVEKSSFSGLPDQPYENSEILKKLHPKVPQLNHIWFYPMGKKRGENQNWFMLPVEERKRLMFEHIETCKKYNETVKRVVTGSSGLDDYEWGISLFSDEALEIKKILYETRFDEVSAVYGLFGSFYVGNRLRKNEIEAYFAL